MIDLPDKLRVIVLMGGKSSEAPISLRSGRQISDSLRRLGHEVLDIDFDISKLDQIVEFKPDMIYIALHGRYGEDGCVQGLLELLGIPYTGSGVMASAVSMDKEMCKTVLRANGIATPNSLILPQEFKISGQEEVMKLNDKIVNVLGGYPCVVKPNNEGSTVGLSIVKSVDQLEAAIDLASKSGFEILMEQFVSGTEVTVAVIGGKMPKALPVIEVVTKRPLLDWEAKYTPGETQHIIPARLPEETIKTCEETAIGAYTALKCRGCARVDMIVSEDGKANVLEMNTIPGMTNTSFVPDVVNRTGIGMDSFVQMMIEDCLNNM